MMQSAITIRPEQYFRMSNGQIIKGIEELPVALSHIDEQTFKNHVDQYKNDFARWIYDVFKKNELSEIIGSVKSKEEMIRILNAYVMHENSKKNSENPNYPVKTGQDLSSGLQETAQAAGQPGPDNKGIVSEVSVPGSSNQEQENISQAVNTKVMPADVKSRPVTAPTAQKNNAPIVKQMPQAQNASAGQSSTIIRSASQKKKQIYVWKTTESMSIADHMAKVKKDIEKRESDVDRIQMIKRPIDSGNDTSSGIKQDLQGTNPNVKTEQGKQESAQKKPEAIPTEPKPEKAPDEDKLSSEHPKPIQEKTEDEDKDEDLSKIKDPDKYFEKNPVLMSQMVENRKKAMTFDQMQKLDIEDAVPAEKAADKFRDAYASAYQHMSQLRKAGYDTGLIEMMLFRIPPKIKVFQASKESKDFAVVKRYINEAIEEINTIRG